MLEVGWDMFVLFILILRHPIMARDNNKKNNPGLVVPSCPVLHARVMICSYVGAESNSAGFCYLRLMHGS